MMTLKNNSGNKDRFVFLSKDYLIEAKMDKRSDRRVEYWKKVVVGGVMDFVKSSKTLLNFSQNNFDGFKTEDGSDGELLIKTYKNNFTIEVYNQGGLPSLSS